MNKKKAEKKILLVKEGRGQDQGLVLLFRYLCTKTHYEWKSSGGFKPGFSFSQQLEIYLVLETELLLLNWYQAVKEHDSNDP